MAETKDLNIEIKNMPLRENRIIDMLAKMRGCNKSVVMRDALVEYANKHLDEITNGFEERRQKPRGT